MREEGYTVVLVNSNPATIMTDPEMADRTYVEPVTWEVVAQIIEKKNVPDALLPTLGGQTGLNSAVGAVERLETVERVGIDDAGRVERSSTHGRAATTLAPAEARAEGERTLGTRPPGAAPARAGVEAELDGLEQPYLDHGEHVAGTATVT